MTSNDLFIIEVFNNRMNGLEEKIVSLQQEMNKKFDEVHQEIAEVRQEVGEVRQEVGEVRQEMDKRFEEVHHDMRELATEIRFVQGETAHIQHSIYWGFALATLLLTVIVAVASFFVTLAPTIKEYFVSKQQQYPTEERVREIVEKAISAALVRRT